METDLINIFGVGYDLISNKYDIVDNSNYIDWMLVHEWNIWLDRVALIDERLMIYPYNYSIPRPMFIPMRGYFRNIKMKFRGEFAIEGGDKDEEAS